MSSIFINNEWQSGGGSVLKSYCPISNEVIWQGKQADLNQVDDAMVSAKSAFSTWAMLSLEERILYLKSYQKLLERDKEHLALLISKEVGKPLWESKTEVTGMINKIDVSISAFAQRSGTTETETTGLTHRPHGVFVILGPYNFPGHLPNGHIIPALLAGNTVIFKPSEQTPMVAEAIIRLFHEANFPGGTVNLIQGDGDIGKALLEVKPDGVLFTGSYQTGKKIHKYFAGDVGVILALEMGGNNPLVISEVENIDAAVFTTIMSAFITSGQRCTCARRLLVPKSKWGDDFLTLLIKRARALLVDKYSANSEPFMGPVISEPIAHELIKKQDEWHKLGANTLLKMSSGQGALLSPGIVDVTDIRYLIEDEELFGPLLQVIRYDDLNDAIGIANDTKYGLSAGIISDDKEEQKIFYTNVRAGVININKPLTGAMGSAPFGGIGCSGNHRPSAYYAADFCAYPVATMKANTVELLQNMPKGISWGE